MKEPASMSPADRRAEVARILSAGFVRYLQKRLAHTADIEAPCDHAVDGREKEEVA